MCDVHQIDVNMPRRVFSAREYGDMILLYGEAHGNASAALRLYRQRFPNREYPSDPRVITAAYQRVVENRPVATITAERQLRDCPRVLQNVRENPRTSVRKAANRLHVSKSTIHRILKRDRQHPYLIRKVHGLLPTDYARRLHFCRFYRWARNNAIHFDASIFWTDESMFTNNGMFNRRNAHIWSHVNPFSIRQTGFQHRWSINVWAGIFGNQIYGPIFLPRRLNGAAYLELINEHIVDIMDSVPLACMRTMWFQHDGAPPHNTRHVTARLNELFGEQWLGRFGPHVWPPRSPDLTPMDFWLWGRIKDEVFRDVCDNVDDMRNRICAAFDNLRQQCLQDNGLLQRVRLEVAWRAQLCIQENGSHIERRGLLRRAQAPLN